MFVCLLQWPISSMTVHVVLPTETLACSPSQEDGVSAAVERAHRFFGCELAQEASVLLRLPQVVAATAQTLLQRFFWRRSLRDFDAFRMAAASLFLAAKSEESPRRARELLTVFYALYRRRKWHRTRAKQQTLDLDSATYAHWREWLLRAERQLLIDIGFSVYTVAEHPHKFILYYIKVVGGSEELAQRAWGYINDSLRWDLCVRRRAEVIACAAIFLAARVLRVKLPDNPHWYVLFGVDRQELYETSIAILEVYNTVDEKVHWLEPLTEVNPFVHDSSGDDASECGDEEEEEPEKNGSDGPKQLAGSPAGPDESVRDVPQPPQRQRTDAHNAASENSADTHAAPPPAPVVAAPPVASRRGRERERSPSPNRSRSRSHSRDRRRSRGRTAERHRRTSRSRSSDRRRHTSSSRYSPNPRRRRSRSRSRSHSRRCGYR